MITQNGLNIMEMQRKTGALYDTYINRLNSPGVIPEVPFEHLPITTRDGTVIQVSNRKNTTYSYTSSGSTHYTVGCIYGDTQLFTLPNTYFTPITTGATPTNIINNPGGSYPRTDTYPLIGTGTNAESLSDYDITNAQPYTSSTSSSSYARWFYRCERAPGSGDMIVGFTNMMGQSIDISEIGLFWTNYPTTTTDNVNKAKNGVLWFRKVFTPITVDDGDTINFRFKRNLDITIS